MRPATQVGSGRQRLEFVIARSGVSLVNHSHILTLLVPGLPWFWVWRWAPADPPPISIFFCTVTGAFPSYNQRPVASRRVFLFFF
ncbi:hypothetical protein BDV26DRAFT_257653, partial [Aspergillus bertholletiae]